MRAVIFGDNNVRIEDVSPEPHLFTELNPNEVSLGKRGSDSSIDCIPKKEIVSEDTIAPWRSPTNSSTIRAAYPLNRCHSFVVGGLVKL